MLQKCPAFNNGCPFKAADSVSNLQHEMASMPVSHTSGSPATMLSEALRQVHKVSVTLKDNVGECPVFSTECIFKVKCSNLKPLISELDLRTWGLHVKTEEVKLAEEQDNTFAKAIRAGTLESHRRAESVPFVRNFLRGRISQEVYASFVAYLYFVYSALEEEARNNATNPVFSCVHFPKELERRESLRNDLEYYYGPDWEKRISSVADVPCVKAYVDRVRLVGKSRPELLVSHSYTRYLGDLSGGQVFKRVVEATYKPPEGKGTNFYHFELLPTKIEHVAFKNNYRKKLDEFNIDKKLADEIVEEANKAMQLNTDIFSALCVMAGIAVESLPPVETTQHGHSNLGSQDKCPFQKAATDAARETPHLAVTQRNDLSYKIHLILKPYYKIIPKVTVAVMLGLIVVCVAIVLGKL